MTFETPIKNGDLKCKPTLKPSKTIKYSKKRILKILNNPSFATTNSEVCLEITFAKINSRIFLF